MRLRSWIRFPIAFLILASLGIALACGEGGTAPREAAADGSDAEVAASTDQISKEGVETVDRMMMIFAALHAYRSDHVFRKPDVQTFDELATVLEPAYVASIPMHDGWGKPFELVRQGDGMWVVGVGGDGVRQMDAAAIKEIRERSVGEIDDPSTDFVGTVDSFTLVPSLGTVWVSDDASTPLKLVHLTVLRFGDRGQYLSVHGVVGNGSNQSFGSLIPEATIACQDNPTAKVAYDRSKRIVNPNTNATRLGPGALRPFGTIVEITAPLPEPCTLTAVMTFRDAGGNVPFVALSEPNLLTEPPGGRAADEAMAGEILIVVNGLNREIYNSILGRVREASYEIKVDDPTEPVPLPFEATKTGLRHHFEFYMVEHDWSPEQVDQAVSTASSQIYEYVSSLTLGPDGYDLSEFKKRNFESLRKIVERKLEKDHEG